MKKQSKSCKSVEKIVVDIELDEISSSSSSDSDGHGNVNVRIYTDFNYCL